MPPQICYSDDDLSISLLLQGYRRCQSVEVLIVFVFLIRTMVSRIMHQTIATLIGTGLLARTSFIIYQILAMYNIVNHAHIVV